MVLLVPVSWTMHCCAFLISFRVGVVMPTSAYTHNAPTTAFTCARAAHCHKHADACGLWRLLENGLLCFVDFFLHVSFTLIVSVTCSRPHF